MSKIKAGLAATVVATAVGTATFHEELMQFLGYWEGDVSETYLDIVQVPTACMGVTGKDVQLGKKYTPEECANMNERAVEEHRSGLERCLTRKPNQSQMIAFTSLAYNIGVARTCKSTAISKFNAGDDKGSCEAIKLWNKAGGKVVKGLVDRRQDEYLVCLRELK